MIQAREIFNYAIGGCGGESDSNFLLFGYYNQVLHFALSDIMYRLLFLLFCFYSLSAHHLSAQDVVKVVNLDEFTVNAADDSFDVADFVDRVRKDTTFYKAFLNLKYFPHNVDGAVAVFKKDESERGTMKRRARQHLDVDEMMSTEITFEETNGNIRKRNGEWKYLTAEMYDEVFFPEGPVKVSNRIKSTEQELVSGSRIDKHKAQLKRMMFNPGAEIENVPFIGDKLAIFDDHMVPYYDYSIFNATVNGIDCIAFSCFAKEGMEDETVIHDLTSYFHPDTYEVLRRDYRLAYSTILFNFDITIKVENEQKDGHLLPNSISYDGDWNALFRKPEIISFRLKCTDYNTRAGKYADQ